MRPLPSSGASLFNHSNRLNTPRTHSAFASDEAAIAHYRQRCSSLQSQLAAAEQDILEFTESSKELQAELESELERMDKAEKGMRKELDDTKNDKEEWKVRSFGTGERLDRTDLQPRRPQNKYTTALRDHTATMTHMQRELETLRATEKSLRTKLRDMELDNDDLEKSERCVPFMGPSAPGAGVDSALCAQRERLVLAGPRDALQQIPRADRVARGGTRRQSTARGRGSALERRAERYVLTMWSPSRWRD